MASLAKTSRPALSSTPMKVFIGSGGERVTRVLSCTDMRQTLVRAQEFVNIRPPVGRGPSGPDPTREGPFSPIVSLLPPARRDAIICAGASVIGQRISLPSRPLIKFDKILYGA
jgi:hypothetical protein